MRDSVRLISLALGATLACSAADLGPGPFVPRPGTLPAIKTDAAIYTLERVEGGYEGEALALYTNTTGRTVHYQRCLPAAAGPMYGLRRTGPDSTSPSFVTAVWACVGGVPTGRVLPGATLSARVSLGSTDSPQAQPPITPEQRVGRFRIEFALCTQHVDDSDDCDALPQAARESNAFELRFAGP